MDLWARTDDQSIKIEISRLVAAIARAQPRTGEEPIPERVIRDARELAALTMLVALGSSHEILLAEGVLALALIAKSAHGGSSGLFCWERGCLNANSHILRQLERFYAFLQDRTIQRCRR